MHWIKRGAGLVAAGAILGVVIGCSRHDHAIEAGDHAGHAHNEAEEGRFLQIHVFGERHEVFAEHRPVVAGTPTQFVTHVTDLQTLEPRREGPARFRLRLGQDAPIERVERAPARPGIYEAMLTFSQAGDWDVALVVAGDEGEETIAFPPVRVFADAHATEHAEVPEPPEGINFLKEQQWRGRVGTEAVSKRKLVERLRLPANVTARPGALAHVMPPVAGRLFLPPGHPMPMVGDRVEAGQVLALIEPSLSEAAARFVEAEGEVVRARLALEQANTAFKRIEILAKVEAKSGRELQQAEFELKTAQARYDAALALQSTYRQVSTHLGAGSGATGQPAVELRSPIAGIITTQSGAAVAEYISAEKAVFTVLDATTVFIEARVPEMSIGRLAETRAASYEQPGKEGQFAAITGDGQGRLVFLGIQVDTVSRTVPLVYEAGNADQRLRVGQSVNLYVETDCVESAVAIPNEAVVEEGGRPIAFVQVGGETFQKRDLTLGIRDGHWVQVVSGVHAGERVVAKGAYVVRLASVSSAIPSHGHAH
ncbi:MAG TPA: efflux RND transporter periplasmic adaptor subunit [Verrucomicrobiota bacterium]|nr:efflux RND transporter periplasmic adaptor subunit [Verrucomicrobiota bacterium]HRZ37299.1 efflux RND transporter periplasmic adaptor subunit [Candidatus Paceibacterota bacterium]HRZ55044.1 efflux RND transporter periplasmic adaptor subunit [Candidatus Paceibacterota bacterium]